MHALSVANTIERAIGTQETRLGHVKLHLPMPLDGTESATDRALVYYMTTIKIDTEGHMVPFRTCLSVLGDILCLSSIVELIMEKINRTCQWWRSV